MPKDFIAKLIPLHNEFGIKLFNQHSAFLFVNNIGQFYIVGQI